MQFTSNPSSSSHADQEHKVPAFGGYLFTLLVRGGLLERKKILGGDWDISTPPTQIVTNSCMVGLHVSSIVGYDGGGGGDNFYR